METLCSGSVCRKTKTNEKNASNITTYVIQYLCDLHPPQIQFQLTLKTKLGEPKQEQRIKTLAQCIQCKT